MSRNSRRGLVIVFTGEGKGKTTAALGTAFRAMGHGMKVSMIQFIKAKNNAGEHTAARRAPGLEITAAGAGFTWVTRDRNKDAMFSRRGWELAEKKIVSGWFDIVILDEINYALHYGHLDVATVLNALRKRPKAVHVILTGRYAKPEIVEIADLVTELVPIKHPYKKGVKAQRGIEF